MMRAAVAEMTAVLAALDRSCATAADVLESGASAVVAYQSSQFGTVRDEFFSTVDRFNRRLTALRAEGIRLLVEEEGRTLTEVAVLVGRSRQFVTRLYRQAAQG